MEYKSQVRYINGKCVYGIVNEKQETVLAFSYSYIREETCKLGRDKEINYFVFYDNKSKRGVFMNGQIIFCPLYDEIELLPIEDENKYYFAVEAGTGINKKCLIISIYKYNRSTGNYQSNTEYKMGDADNIKVVNGNVMLYKNNNKGLLKGVFNSKTMGDLYPQYTKLDYNPNYYNSKPHMPDISHDLNETVEWDFTGVKKNIQTMTYGLLKYNKEHLGVYINANKGILNDGKPVWEEFIFPDYSKILFDISEHLIYLTETKYSKTYKSLMGFSENWDIDTKGSLVTGSVTYSKEFLLQDQYDDLQVLTVFNERYTKKESIRIKYIVVKKDDKYGLIKVIFQSSKSTYSGNKYFPAKIETMLECQCDFIRYYNDYTKNNSFIFQENGNKGLIIDTEDNFLKIAYKDKNNETSKTEEDFVMVEKIKSLIKKT